MFKLKMYFLMPTLVFYAQYLRGEREKARKYVDMRNNTRNHMMRGEEYTGSWGFMRDWLEYEEEYMCNWDRG